MISNPVEAWWSEEVRYGIIIQYDEEEFKRESKEDDSSSISISLLDSWLK